MARDIDRPILHAQAVEMFTNDLLPTIKLMYEQDGIPDIPARSEAWCNWTDSLCKSEVISDWQYENWSHPPCNE